jgi:hypothetical protein
MSDTRSLTKPESTVAARTGWIRPQIEWLEEYEPVVFTASCTSQPFNCGAGAQS